MGQAHDMNAESPSPSQRFGADEWAARVQLAAAYRIFHLLGWTELIYNHISLRVPGDGAHFLINPFGLHYSEVTASNLMKVDLDGHIVGASDWPFNPAGFTPHATIHAGIADAHCVMHTHTTAGMAVACLDDGLSMSNFYSAQLHGKLAYHLQVREEQQPERALALLRAHAVRAVRHAGERGEDEREERERPEERLAHLPQLQRALQQQEPRADRDRQRRRGGPAPVGPRAA